MAKKPRLRVSDHAIVRYLERVGGFDIDGLRAQITARLQTAADAGAASIRVEDHVFILGDDPTGPVVVTVIDKPCDAEGHQRRFWDGGGRR
jgi:hypothetical protein